MSTTKSPKTQVSLVETPTIVPPKEFVEEFENEKQEIEKDPLAPKSSLKDEQKKLIEEAHSAKNRLLLDATDKLANSPESEKKSINNSLTGVVKTVVTLFATFVALGKMLGGIADAVEEKVEGMLTGWGLGKVKEVKEKTKDKLEEEKEKLEVKKYKEGEKKENQIPQFLNKYFDKKEQTDLKEAVEKGDIEQATNILWHYQIAPVIKDGSIYFLKIGLKSILLGVIGVAQHWGKSSYDLVTKPFKAGDYWFDSLCIEWAKGAFEFGIILGLKYKFTPREARSLLTLTHNVLGWPYRIPMFVYQNGKGLTQNGTAIFKNGKIVIEKGKNIAQKIGANKLSAKILRSLKHIR